MIGRFIGKSKDIAIGLENNSYLKLLKIDRGNENSQKFVNDFLEIAKNNPALFSDEFNDYKRNEKFHDHRHDQSVSSCLVKLKTDNPILFDDMLNNKYKMHQKAKCSEIFGFSTRILTHEECVKFKIDSSKKYISLFSILS